MSKRLKQLLQSTQASVMTGMASDLQKSKTLQPIGIDAFACQSLPAGLLVNAFGPVTISAGGTGTFRATSNANEDILTLWNYLSTIYVDPPSFPTTGNQTPESAGSAQSAYAYPGGSALSSGQKSMMKSDWMDWATSDDVTNKRSFFTGIMNLDTVSHNYYIIVKTYLPQ